ncbi:MAG: 16S rRNA (cytosine(1402)-N(4))-methyltransferase RsmH [Helicobacter sp.]|uniref:16S rRNA (cytosine(1402)-N(4))-methyltransferase RsmH n=1 Tax=Helicobacter sp. TaxID=218 RepID=UPI002A913265|nr:16S rRNA (cytosine(1402)-N(4))-methyltransferase RsmH [Helicobacter sp.]MDY5822457.1 16S rRNA (cytosine(1402)-N(4))-methyltransferase RsmH [Helicobacter sp.]
MIFGIDFGLKRLGVAKVVQNIIMPLAPIMRKNRNQASKDLANLLLAHESDMSKITLVVGMPRDMDIESDSDTESSGAGRHEVMRKRISHFLNLIDFSGQVIYIDESYSSKEANERLLDRGYNKRKNARKNGVLDSISACVILERYLEKINALSHRKEDKQNRAGCESIDRESSLLESRVVETSVPESKDMESKHTESKNENCLTNPLQTKNANRVGGTLDSNFTNSVEPSIDSKQIYDKQKEKSPHIPVLLEHVLDTFDRIFRSTHSHYIAKKSLIKNKEVLIDCTLGFGGMSRALLERYSNLHIIGIDRDSYALEYNRESMVKFGDRFQTRHGDFATLLPQIIKEIEANGDHLCGILADIGVSSYQLDSIERGFSFHSSTLDMRMDRTQSLDADMIVNTYSKYELEEIFKNYGEIREYKKLANLIVQERQRGRITADSLQNIALKLHSKAKIHPATLIYQALRIAVNDELGQLKSLLHSCQNLHEVLLCVISFHSLEDRMIKESFKQFAKSCICDTTSFKCVCGNNHAKGFSLYKKPLIADSKEIAQNKRSRSAKLRAFYFA